MSHDTTEPRLIRVIKLGGSIFGNRESRAWDQRFVDWYSSLRQDSPTGMTDLLIVGGGNSVNQLRQLAKKAKLSEYVAHWIAIGFMSVNARLAADRLGIAIQCVMPCSGDPPVQAATGVLSEESQFKHLFVFDPSLLLQSNQIALETSWRITSDSIAAAVARRYNADELILLKSAIPPTEDLRELARQGYIDEMFPQIAASLCNVQFVTC